MTAETSGARMKGPSRAISRSMASVGSSGTQTVRQVAVCRTNCFKISTSKWCQSRR